MLNAEALVAPTLSDAINAADASPARTARRARRFMGVLHFTSQEEGRNH
jgi:hypothetical protein